MMQDSEATTEGEVPVQQLVPAKETWTFRIAPDVLHFGSPRGEASFVVLRAQAAEDLSLRHGIIARHAVQVRSRKRLFNLGPEPFDRLLAWLTPFRRKLLGRDLLRLCVSLLIVVFVSLNGPLGWKTTSVLFAPALVALALVGWRLPHRAGFATMGVAFAGAAAIELWGVAQGGSKLRLFFPVFEALQCHMAFALFRIYRWPEPTERRSAWLVPSIVLMLAFAAGVVLASLLPVRTAARGAWRTFDSAHLGLRLQLPERWSHDRDHRSVAADGNEYLTSIFFKANRPGDADEGALQFVVVDTHEPLPPPDETFVEEARGLAEKIARRGFRDQTLTLGSCRAITVPRRSVVRCTATTTAVDKRIDAVITYVWHSGSRIVAALFLLPGHPADALRETDTIVANAEPWATRAGARSQLEDLPECVEYIEKMDRCIQSLPEDQRAWWRDSSATTRAEWERRLARGGPERDFVRTACSYSTRSMHDGAKWVRLCPGVWHEPPTPLPPPNPKAPFYSIPACSEYAVKMERCLAAKDFPPAARDLMRRDFDDKRALFEAIPEGTEAFRQLPSSCAALVDAMGLAMKTFCPGIW